MKLNLGKFNSETDVRIILFLKVCGFFTPYSVFNLEKIINSLVGVVLNQIHHPL